MCGGRIFNVKTVKDSCKLGHGKGTLMYSQLVNFYNELVIQLRLAQHNLNTTIVKEEYLSEQLKVIKLLGESILPALETTVSHSYVYSVVIVTILFVYFIYS